MIARLLLSTGAAALLVIASAASATAEVRPRPGPSDPRVRVVDYNPDDVVRVTGVFRSVTQIVFDPSEAIQHVALGDTVAWEVAAQGNLLFIKPTEHHAGTNLIVTTRRGAALRNYSFELDARQGGISVGSANTFYQVRFRYPADEEAARLALTAAVAANIETKIVDTELSLGVLRGRRNYEYTAQGASALQPSEVSDNGQFTVMRFPANQALPAIFQVLPDGSESVVPFDVRNDYVVIHATAGQFRLRRGASVLCIYNEALERYGRDTGTKTVSPDIERTTAPEGSSQ